jgi:hypothetical protein
MFKKIYKNLIKESRLFDTQNNDNQKKILNRGEFINQAKIFLNQLSQTNSGEEIRKLWKSTNLKYKMLPQDPYSSDYRNEVLKLYKDLTDFNYNH